MSGASDLIPVQSPRPPSRGGCHTASLSPGCVSLTNQKASGRKPETSAQLGLQLPQLPPAASCCTDGLVSDAERRAEAQCSCQRGMSIRHFVENFPRNHRSTRPPPSNPSSVPFSCSGSLKEQTLLNCCVKDMKALQDIQMVETSH
ncbi:unnamed protein product [Pleuronectes platessa]|uniref:Uncharacterized protein n=1 Tax=Pleuronectes platessa TaxID=8262 RepID=A0A9N7U161_PLEPL|nr:unnamed protein product [Pleuronectes platessa]